MAQQCYISKAFKSDSYGWIGKIRAICESYARQGYKLSLRQVYYQLVAHHALPNKEQSYKNIGSLLTDARLAGLIDWDMIEDRNRETVQNPHWDGPADIVRACARQFRIKLWDKQPYHVELMVEKAALEGVVGPVCARWDIPFTSNRGYSSSSAMRESGLRMKDAIDAGKRVLVLYMGDHDPSGIDMTRDVRDRLLLFTEVGWWSTAEDADDCEAGIHCYPDQEDLEVCRLALNMDQVRRYNPPPNPAKMTDSRADSYVRQHGASSWELDALEPTVMAALIDDAVREVLDEDAWGDAMKEQDSHRDRLAEIANQLGREPEEE